MALRWVWSLTRTVMGFFSGAVVGEGVGLVEAADCSEVSSVFVPLLLVLVIVGLFGVVVLVMPEVRQASFPINQPRER